MHLDEKTLKHRLSVFIGVLVITLALERAFLAFFPNVTVHLGQYHIHHLYTGAFLLILTMILFLFGTITDWTMALAGYSSALVLDELIPLTIANTGDIAYGKESTIGAILTTLAVVIFAMVLYHVKKTRVLSREDIAIHLKIVASLAVLQFLLNLVYIYIYPIVNPIRAAFIGLSALAILYIPSMKRLVKMKPYLAFIPIFSSAFFGSLLVREDIVHQKSLASGLAHVAILAVTYFTIIILKNGNRKNQL